MLKLRPVRRFRRGAGLPPSRLDSYLDCGGPNAANAVVGLFSRHLAARQPDQPSNCEISGFPFYRSSRAGHEELDPGVERFLAAGEAPIVFTLGSFATESAGLFYEEGLAAARSLGRRALLLTGARAGPRVAALTGEAEFVIPYAPHELIFPRCACVVHHAGIGTTALALRSGRPQLAVPFFGDQFDIAARLVRLGVAARLAPSEFTAPRAASALAGLLDGTRPACAKLAAAVEAENGADEVADKVLALIG